MADQVSKSMTTVGWLLVSIIAIAVFASMLYAFSLFLGSPEYASWVKILVAIGLLGAVLLLAVVVRDRWREQKTDKYKDIEI